MDAAVRARPAAADGTATICIRTIVTAGAVPERNGAVDAHEVSAYEVSVGGDTAGVRRVAASGPSGAPAIAEAAEGTVTFLTDRATAVAIASGRESAQAAFMAGRLRVDGDTRLLMAQQSVLGELDDLFGPVRAATDFDPTPAS